jgi:hypothetical protein
MGLRDPVAIYNAADNNEAHLLCILLNNAGIEAFVTDDVSPVGICVYGLLSEIHKPQVWTDRSEVDRVKPLLDDYERQLRERRATGTKEHAAGGDTLEAVCEECGRTSVFPAARAGTTQDCRYCGAYMDVGGPSRSERPWPESRSDEDEDASEEQ